MVQASTDSEGIRALAVALEGANQQVSAAVDGMTRALKSAQWDDAQRLRFEQRLRELAKVAAQFNDGTATTVPFLKQKADQIDAYLH